jgi:2-phospho-L-lactate guanylyltransferase
VLGVCAGIDGVMVVTNGDDVADLSRAKGAVVARDAADPPLGAILDAALEDLSARGAGGALVLMSDLPLLDAADVARLVDMMRRYDVVAAPDLRGAGTNALGISPPLRMRTSFGARDSFDRHRIAALAAGLSVGIHRSAGLALDVDEPEDLARLSGSPRRGDDHPS